MVSRFKFLFLFILRSSLLIKSWYNSKKFKQRSPLGSVHKKHTEKSCIKAAAYVPFFNFLVWILFECGLYSRAAYMHCSGSAKPGKAVWPILARCDMYSESELDFVIVTKLLQNVIKRFGMQRAVEVKPWTIFGRHSQATSSIMSAANVQHEFGERAASIFLRLLF